jgi:hypothetical protein
LFRNEISVRSESPGGRSTDSSSTEGGGYEHPTQNNQLVTQVNWIDRWISAQTSYVELLACFTGRKNITTCFNLRFSVWHLGWILLCCYN